MKKKNIIFFYLNAITFSQSSVIHEKNKISKINNIIRIIFICSFSMVNLSVNQETKIPENVSKGNNIKC